MHEVFFANVYWTTVKMHILCVMNNNIHKLDHVCWVNCCCLELLSHIIKKLKQDKTCVPVALHLQYI